MPSNLRTIKTGASHIGIDTTQGSYSVNDIRENRGLTQGDLQISFSEYPLTLLTYNTAFIMARYGGHDEEKAAQAFVGELKNEPAEVVGLCELFKIPFFRPGFRDYFQRNLEDQYPYQIIGPSQGEYSDSGLLLLSKHPILHSHKMVYMHSASIWEGSYDDWSSKGAIHAAIAVPGLGPVDVFLTHCQSTKSDTSSEWDDLKLQLTDLGVFWKAFSNPDRPSFLMGDLNTPDDHPEFTQTLLPDLDKPVDLWRINHPDSPGLTFVNGNTFSGSQRTGAREARLDYIFMQPPRKKIPLSSKTEIVRWKDEDNKDVSDHFGLRATFTRSMNLDVDPSGSIGQVKVEMVRFYFIHANPELGDLLTGFEFQFVVKTQFTTAHDEPFTRAFEGLRDYHDNLPNNATAVFNGDPGNKIEIELDGYWSLGTEPQPRVFNKSTMEIPRDILLQDHGGTIKRLMPVEGDNLLTAIFDVDIKVQ